MPDEFGNGDGGSPQQSPVGTALAQDGGVGDAGDEGASDCIVQELCNDGLDNDCDELADEGCVCDQGEQQPCYAGAMKNAGVGACEQGSQHCAQESEFSTWGQCEGSVLPVAEICDNLIDDNCDGRTDEGCICDPPATRACYSGTNQTRAVGACGDGVVQCELHDGEGAWGDDCEDEHTPTTELCGNDVDEDCDGALDNGCICARGDTEACYTGPIRTLDVGLCHAGSIACEVTDGAAQWLKDCVDEVTPATELCGNDVDEDCDHELDNGCLCALGDTNGCYTGSNATRGVGACHDGLADCEISAGLAAWGVQCVDDATPATELCGNTTDEDCDGTLNNGCLCDDGDVQACYPGSGETRGVGACHDGEVTCSVQDGVAQWGTDCEDAKLPATEICGNSVDEDCDGNLDNGCDELECPQDMTTPAGDLVNVVATGSGFTQYTFTIIAGPNGGPSSAVWSGINANMPSAQVTAYIVGAYTIEVTAEDASGSPHSCSFELTALPHGLRVQLAWDGTGDVDLHLHNGNASPWFDPVDDCYYSYRYAAWGASLDVDNIMGPGPENIVVDDPVIGTTYVIGVHEYSSTAEGRIASVDVFCGDTQSTIPLQTFVSRPLAGLEAGNCTGNDFWHVARVTFTDASTCVIDPIDDYVTSTVACMTL